MRVHRRRAIIVLGFAALVAAHTPAWDRPETASFLLLADRLTVGERLRPAVGPVAAVAEADFTYFALRSVPLDRHHIGVRAHAAAVGVGRTIGTIALDTTLYSGNVNTDVGDVPGAAVAPWMMNAVQFEYGVTVQRRFGERLVIVGEYSRRSYHPLRGGPDPGFAQPAADLLRIGGGARDIAVGPIRVDGVARIGWQGLFAFWQAPHLPAVRGPWQAITGVTVTGPPLAGAVPFVRLHGDVTWGSGVVELDRGGEVGIRIEQAGGALELWLDWYASPNTEQLRDEPTPTDLIGIGVRFATGAP